MAALSLYLRLALRNILSNPWTITLGVLIALASTLFVVAGCVVGAIDTSISRSVSGSLSGDLQVYSSHSEDELDLFEAIDNRPPKLEAIRDFSRVRDALLKVANVKNVVPMGTYTAQLAGETALDMALAHLRSLERTALSGGKVDRPEIAATEDHIRQIVSLLQRHVGDAREFFSAAEIQENVDALKKAASPEFWASFDRDPLGGLEFLENHVAPQLSEGEPLDVGFFGTDLPRFRQAFPRMEIVDGHDATDGRRGILLSKFFYESNLKLKVARRLDQIKAARQDGREIKDDDELKLWVRQNTTQTRDVLLQLNRAQAERFTRLLQAQLGSKETDLEKLLAQFFDTRDETFDARYKFFYDQLAPDLQLYRLRIGEPITLRAATYRGTIRSVSVPVVGTYRFQGLGDSELIGNVNLLDLVSFRRLYGLPSEEEAADEKALVAEVGISPDVFKQLHDDAAVGNVGRKVTVGFSDDALFDGAAHRELVKELDRSFTREELDHGMVLNAAVLLADPAQAEPTMRAVQQAADAAKLDLKVVSWEDAGGMMGKVALISRAVLLLCAALVLLAALVVINNAMLITALQRTAEIGTMRAIGAQRSTVLGILLCESAMLGLGCGGFGTLLGVGIVRVLEHVGIAAPGEAATFLFSGPRLFPPVSVGVALFAASAMLAIAIISSISPALHSIRVSPTRAMRGNG